MKFLVLSKSLGLLNVPGLAFLVVDLIVGNLGFLAKAFAYFEGEFDSAGDAIWSQLLKEINIYLLDLLKQK